MAQERAKAHLSFHKLALNNLENEQILFSANLRLEATFVGKEWNELFLENH
jgi:hypothetical protein